MIKDFLTKNVALKLMAVSLAIILWAIARYWIIK
jgi:hypothetical protein